jgi:hypothetical protein
MNESLSPHNRPRSRLRGHPGRAHVGGPGADCDRDESTG